MTSNVLEYNNIKQILGFTANISGETNNVYYDKEFRYYNDCHPLCLCPFLTDSTGVYPYTCRDLFGKGDLRRKDISGTPRHQRPDTLLHQQGIQRPYGEDQ